MSRSLGIAILLSSVASAQELPGSYLDRFLLAYGSLEHGRHDDAATLYESCLELASRNATVAYHLACTSAQAGRIEDALMWLGQAVDWGSGDAAVMEWDPYLEPLRDDPRFGAVVKKASMASDRGQADATLVFALDDRKLAPADRYWLKDVEIGYRSVGWPVVLPDGRTVLAPTSDGPLRLFDLESGERIRTLAGHRSEVHHVAVLDGGRSIVTASKDGTARVWDLADGRARASFDTFAAGGWGMETTLHPDQDRLATFGSDAAARVWSIERGDTLYEIGPGVTHVAWSPDGELLAASFVGGSVRLFDADTGRAVSEPMTHAGRVHHLAFDREGERIATGSVDEFVRVWDVESGRLLEELELSGDFFIGVNVYLVVWTPAGDLVATTGSWPTVGCFDGETLEPRWMYELAGGTPSTLHAVPNADGTRLYVSGMVTQHSRVLDASNGAVLEDLGDRGFFDLTPTPDERLVLATRLGTVVLDRETFEERYTRTEWKDDGEIVHLPNLIHQGSRAALREARIRVDGFAYPLDSYASHLLDPRRVLASAAGIEVRNPVLPPAPRIDAPPPRHTVVQAGGNERIVTVQASDGAGVLGFQLERDGEVLPAGAPGASLERSAQTATLTWRVNRPESGETHLRIRAVGRSGVLSKAVLTTIRWDQPAPNAWRAMSIVVLVAVVAVLGVAGSIRLVISGLRHQEQNRSREGSREDL